MRRPATRCRGFTLLELLVVVLLVGLLTSLAVLGIQGRSVRERQHEEARRLLARMDLAREEAVLRAGSLGLRLTPRGYRFLQLRNGAWHVLRDDRTLAPHELPAGMRLEVDVDGLEVALADDGDGGEDGTASGAGIDDDDGGEDGDDDGPPRPQVFFLAGGEIVPGFTIGLLAEDTDVEYRLTPGQETWLELTEHGF